MPPHKHAPLNSFIPLPLYFHLLSISPSVGFSVPTKGFVSANWQALGTAECTLGFIAYLLPSIEQDLDWPRLCLAERRLLTVPHQSSDETSWSLSWGCGHTRTQHSSKKKKKKQEASILTVKKWGNKLFQQASLRKKSQHSKHCSRKSGFFFFQVLTALKKKKKSVLSLCIVKNEMQRSSIDFCTLCCSCWASYYLTMQWPVVINLKWFQRFNKSVKATSTATQDDENGHSGMTRPLNVAL